MRDKLLESKDRALSELEHQFPEGAETEYYDELLNTEGGVLVCDRKKYPTLQDAARFFREKKLQHGWKYDSVIYRAGRYWCLRVWPKYWETEKYEK